jgi:hypothetical protein
LSATALRITDFNGDVGTLRVSTRKGTENGVATVVMPLPWPIEVASIATVSFMTIASD